MADDSSTPGDEAGAQPDRAPASPVPDRAERPVGRPALVFDDPLSRPSRDDTDSGWGGDGESARDEAWYRRETPPHHGG